MAEQIIPDIPNIKAHWDHRSVNPIPYLMVPMSNGSVLRYNPEIEHPKLTKIMEGMRNLSAMVQGYPVPDDMIPGQMTIEDLLNGEEREHGSNDRRDA